MLSAIVNYIREKNLDQIFCNGVSVRIQAHPRSPDVAIIHTKTNTLFVHEDNILRGCHDKSDNTFSIVLK